ncbi:hypothetical protein GCM10023340_36230 [Nocardioides marinquilinus]|uniref:Glycosyltransferase n=1 Tax=Nocardioides marinquilinus TaxID=1210400 RepID=A0ABP9PX72_9ACTN
MRVAFLIATVHDRGGTAGAVATQANALVARPEVTSVEVLSVYRRDDGHHFPLDPRVVVRDLADLRPGAGADPSLTGRPPLQVPLGTDPGLDAHADVTLEAALPGLEADVLVTVTPAMLAYAVQLAPARTAVVHQEHRASHSRPNGRDLLLDRARRADTVAMLTEPMAHWLRGELGASSPPVVVVPNALAPGYRPRSRLTEPVIVAAGRLDNEKRWPALVGAFAEVADRMPGWRVRIFGDGPARFDIMATARRHGLWDRVELPGPTTDMTTEWARGSISALTSQPGEGFPLVIQEAMAAGVPVVAYDMPTGPRDQIHHGVDGLLVTQGGQQALAAALLRLATDDAERQRLGEAALATAAGWDSAAITDRWVEVLGTAVERRSHAAGGAGRSAVVHAQAPPTPPPDADVAPHGHEGAGLTPQRCRHEALAAVAAAVRAAVGERGWFVLPPHRTAATVTDGDDPPTVVVPMAAREPVVRALGAGGALPPYLSLHDPEARGWPSRRGRPEEMVAPLLRARSPRLLVEPWPRVGGAGAADDGGGTGPLDLGPGPWASLLRGCGVAVELWEAGPDGALHSPGGATYATQVPPDVVRDGTVVGRVHDVEVPVLPGTLVPTPFELRGEVDAVYTWVDGSDPAWDAARAARLDALDDPRLRERASSGRARYLDRGELRYSLRSLHLFAPWVRRIHVVTAGQVPAWLDVDHPRIHLVDHADLLPPEALPTFNSHAIETALHRIDGLAEHFVYLNDDFVLGRPTRPEAFFGPGGTTAVVPSTSLVGLPGEQRLPWAWAAQNNRRLLHDALGVELVTTLAHAPYAHRVSVLREVEARFAEAVAATARAPFRSPTDVSMLSSLAQHYGLATGTAHVAQADWAFVDLSAATVRRRLLDLLERDRDGFCLADQHDFARDPEVVTALVTRVLETYLPVAAPWER